MSYTLEPYRQRGYSQYLRIQFLESVFEGDYSGNYNSIFVHLNIDNRVSQSMAVSLGFRTNNTVYTWSDRKTKLLV
jgi:hypothetical protein